jgi:UDP-glucose 4-epimerase
MRRIRSAIVTGGAGFIGSHIVDALVEAGTRTTVIDDLSSGAIEHVHPGAAFVRADISNPDVIQVIVDRRPQVVIHAAAQVSVAASTERPAYDRRINLIGTENVLAGARKGKARRFVFISSGGAVYGEAALASEGTLPDPASHYGIHKLAAEGYVRTSGLSYAIARLANVYGPRQRTDLEGGVVAIFIDRLRRGEPLTLHGTGFQSRDFVYVSDVVEATILMAAAAGTGTWNVSTGEATSVRMLLTVLEELVSPAVRILRAPRRAGDVEVSCLSSRLIESALGWRPRHSLPEGLRRTISEDTGSEFRASP